MGSTNKDMKRFVGKKMVICTPARKSDGNRVLYAHEPGNFDNWYFYTSTIVTINRTADLEGGIEKCEVHTHNSVYRFFRNC